MNKQDCEDRYARSDDGLWSGRANGVLAAELPDLAPGRALDGGCGEGPEAIWLARAGWQTTGVDVPEVALERAAAAARDEQVTVMFCALTSLPRPSMRADTTWCRCCTRP